MPHTKKVSRRQKKVTHTVRGARTASRFSLPKGASKNSFPSKEEMNRVNATFSENSQKMMRKRYLVVKENGDQESPAEMMTRVAKTLADVETKYGKNSSFVEKTAKDFFEVMARKEFTPAGRTLTNAGGGTAIVANCIVLPIHDSMESIFQTLKDAALLQQAGSGLGFAFDELRPALTPTKRSRGSSSGPVSFLKVYNEAFGVIKQQGRHGANMAMMTVDHPDVLDFIRAKEVEGEIRNFNISIKVTDEFMRQVTEHPDAQWYCTWKGVKTKPHKVIRAKNGSAVAVEEIDITAKQIFDELVHYAWTNGEPGIVFIDEVNRTNPLPALGDIKTSNPCGEQFLHAYDNCNLGSLNLAAFVIDGKMDWARLKKATSVATRMLDNVIDIFDFPVPQVTELAQRNRRIGLGIMGFADMLFKLGVPYNSKEGIALGERVMKAINQEAHATSEQLAKDKGAFPNIKLSVYAKKGVKIRNAALTTVAPTGSISMMLDTSSGIEPNFALSFVKQDKDGHQYHYFNSHFEQALKQYKLTRSTIERVKSEVVRTGSIQALTDLPEELRKTFVVAMDISADDHMNMQAAFQRHVDNSISKTINFPNSATEEDVVNGFVTAWKMKCKSCTVYREGSRSVQILNLGTGEGLVSPADIPNKTSESVPTKTALPAPQKEVALKINTSSVISEHVEPRSRPEVMPGKTYKLRTGYGNIYVTINDDENRSPFEVFATIGKSGGFFQEQSEGICRLVSLALRSGVSVEDVIHNIKGIRGPMPVITDKGTILSLPDAIGRILELHVQSTKDGVQHEESSVLLQPTVAAQSTTQENSDVHLASSHSFADNGMMPGCPDCDAPLVVAEGCISCKSCGFSRCM